MADRPTLDRRGFLELAATSTVVVATGAVALGCQDPPASGPPAPAVVPTSTDPLAVWFSALRGAEVRDDVEPAMVFRPLPQRRS
jgi:hypothetical protein